MSGRIYDFTSLDPLDDIGTSKGAVGADNLPVIATIDDLARQALSFEGSLLDCWLSDVLLTQEQLHVTRRPTGRGGRRETEKSKISRERVLADLVENVEIAMSRKPSRRSVWQALSNRGVLAQRPGGGPRA